MSGQEIVTHIEGLPVDRMSRPLQDAKVVNCGELVLKIKSKGRYECYLYKCRISRQRNLYHNFLCMFIAKKRETKQQSSADSDSDSYADKTKKKKKKKRYVLSY